MAYEMELKTKIKFGIGIVDSLGKTLSEHKVKKVLFVYGGGSIKTIGLYEKIIKELKKSKIQFIEHSGVKPNPRVEHINEGGLKARKNKCDAILAVGGGSVVDAAKVMGIFATNTKFKDSWDLWIHSKNKKDSLPIFSFITLAATGSENNGNSVLTNDKTNQKFSGSHASCIPIVSFEDPEITKSVDMWNTACGAFDVFCHALEIYLSENLLDWTRFYLSAQMKNAIKSGKKLMRNLNDIDVRGEILITSSMALNSIASFGGAHGDWVTHRIEHGVSAVYDVSHGAGLALILPYFLEYGCKQNKLFAERIKQLGEDVFNSNSYKKTIKKIKEFIKILNLPTKMEQFPNTSKPINRSEDINLLVKHFNDNLLKDGLTEIGSIFKVNEADARKIISMLYKG